MRRRRWLLLVGIVVVLAGALGAKGRAYLSGRPEACTACHAMVPRHVAWKTGPHGRVATCADCHVPQDGMLEGLGAKVGDGARHSTVQLTGRTPAFIHVKRDASRATLQANCLRCHEALLSPEAWRALPRLGTTTATIRPRPRTAFHADPSRACTDCHRKTGHETS